MGRNIFILLVLAGVGLFSCKNSGSGDDSAALADNAIVQGQDGTISLEVTKADKYLDVDEPETNTAEWSVVVSKSGRYDVWLSSATKDTTKLSYNNAVMLSVKDDLLEARPSVDKIIQNSIDVSYPYYRAESFLGSLYFKDAGVYNIQVISDMIASEEKSDNSEVVENEDTRMISVSLKPAE